jgi:hypothetical protein
LKFSTHFSGLMNPHLPTKLSSEFRTLQRPWNISYTPLVRITKATNLHLLIPSFTFIPTPWNISDIHGREHQGQCIAFATTTLYFNAMELL